MCVVGCHPRKAVPMSSRYDRQGDDGQFALDLQWGAPARIERLGGLEAARTTRDGSPDVGAVASRCVVGGTGSAGELEGHGRAGRTVGRNRDRTRSAPSATAWSSRSPRCRTAASGQRGPHSRRVHRPDRRSRTTTVAFAETPTPGTASTTKSRVVRRHASWHGQLPSVLLPLDPDRGLTEGTAASTRTEQVRNHQAVDRCAPLVDLHRRPGRVYVP